MINGMHFNWNKFRLHNVLRSNHKTSLSSATKFLDIVKTVLEKRVTVVALEMCLSGKALM